MGKKQSKQVLIDTGPAQVDIEGRVITFDDFPDNLFKLFKYNILENGTLDVKNQPILELIRIMHPFKDNADLTSFTVLPSEFSGDSFIKGGNEMTELAEIRKLISDEVDLRQASEHKYGKAIGCFLGMVCGDALGHTLEFLPVNYSDKLSINTIVGGGKFMLLPGQWTDDASMGLCLADSLLLRDPKTFEEPLDCFDLMLRFQAWWYFGYNNAFKDDTLRENKHSVGLGGTIGRALNEFRRKGLLFTEFGDKNSSGNGSIMRLAGIPVRFWESTETACKVASDSSKVTHQGIEAAECCRLLAHICTKLIQSSDSNKEVLLEALASFSSPIKSVMRLAESQMEDKDPDRDWNWKAEDFRYSPTRSMANPGYVGSYCMDCMSMALHCVWHTNSFEEALVLCVNKRGDADTVGSVCGQIAGSLYGVSSVPVEWRRMIRKWDSGGDVELKAHLLFEGVQLFPNFN